MLIFPITMNVLQTNVNITVRQILKKNVPAEFPLVKQVGIITNDSSLANTLNNFDS